MLVSAWIVPNPAMGNIQTAELPKVSWFSPDQMGMTLKACFYLYLFFQGIFYHIVLSPRQK